MNVSLRGLLGRLARKSDSAAPAPPRPRFRPSLEGVEDRTVPALITSEIATLSTTLLSGVTNTQFQFGLVGPQGPAGLIGPAGPRGELGPVGLVGPVGPQGELGIMGLAGVPGLAGAAGPAGPMGLMGLAGLPGMTGTTGPAGPPGAPGMAGGLAAYGYIFNQSAQTVAIESPIAFDLNGPLLGVTHLPGNAGIAVTGSGIYAVRYSVSGVEPGQFAVFVNGARAAGTVYGSGAGTQQDNGLAILTLSANDVLTLVNHSSAAAVTLQTLAGGTQTNVNAAFLIEKLA